MLIRGQADIEIFISENGYICLRQETDAGEQLISFAPAYAAKLAPAIAQLQEFAQRKFEAAELIDD